MIFEFFVFVLCLIAHELGHYISAKLYGLKPQYRFERGCLLMRTYPQSIKMSTIITLSGILAGFIPLLIAYPYLPLSTTVLFVFLLIAGSHIDFKILYKNLGL